MKNLEFRWKNIQSNVIHALKEGCLFFCICIIIEQATNKTVDFIDVFQRSLKMGWLKPDGEVTDSLAILRHYTNHKWRRVKVAKEEDFRIDIDYYIVQKWQHTNGKTHFRPVQFDIYENSLTVNLGRLVEHYVYYITDKEAGFE
jgi:hypothetical protein